MSRMLDGANRKMIRLCGASSVAAVEILGPPMQPFILIGRGGDTACAEKAKPIYAPWRNGALRSEIKARGMAAFS